MYFQELFLRWLFKWAGKRAFVGRYIDRQDPSKGRFTTTDLNRVLKTTMQYFEILLPKANIGRFETLGSRMNVMLGVASLAMNKALLDEGVERDYAVSLFADVAWKVYEKFVVLPRLLARLATRDPQKRMNFILHSFLRFPFNSSGYRWKIKSQDKGFQIDFFRCPVRDYFHEIGAEDFLLNSWCTLDYALAQVMVKNGHYERSHTLSAGDPLCDMTWSA
jgi:hypothetical protein